MGTNRIASGSCVTLTSWNHSVRRWLPAAQLTRFAFQHVLIKFCYRAAGRTLVRGVDGSVDSCTAAGQLSLSALNRVIASPTV
jgi:hypothetical protein